MSIQREAVTASVDYRLSPASTLAVGLGAGLGGFISVNPPSPGPARFAILPGYEITLSYSRRLLDGRGNLPYVLLGVSGGASGASTQLEGETTAPSVPFYAFDVRASVIVGKTFWNALSPYAVVRGFGGPIVWTYEGSGVIGSDRYHFQLGGGLVTVLPKGVDVFVEGVPLGERAVTLGAGKTF